MHDADARNRTNVIENRRSDSMATYRSAFKNIARNLICGMKNTRVCNARLCFFFLSFFSFSPKMSR